MLEVRLTRLGVHGPFTTLAEMDDQPPICPRCGVTMVPAALSADAEREGDWVCLECEELGEDA